ncbi:MAG TPA: amidohydrolase [Verrucomicrobiae bacterium]|nr:amidohydrolase [Verrucomicrobiae bacterium]
MSLVFGILGSNHSGRSHVSGSGNNLARSAFSAANRLRAFGWRSAFRAAIRKPFLGGVSAPEVALPLLLCLALPGIFQTPPAPTSTAANAAAPADAHPRADLLFIHANVYTGVPDNTPFSSIDREEAIAVRGDRILAVGKMLDLQKWKGPQTQVIDLGGHFVMPGFNDAHLHLADAGSTKLSVDLTGVKSLDELRERVARKVETAPAGEWILGGGWDETLWPVKVPPTRWDLDEVSNGHPVFLVRIDGHIAVANTRALQLGSITLASRDPMGGHIDRNENGEPSGILRETAQEAITNVIPKPSHDLRRQGLELALSDLAQHGVTSAQDYSPEWENFEIFEELEKDGKLTARISEWLPFDDSLEDLSRKRNSHPQSDLMLHTGMLKGFMDGSLGSHTAALLQPYADDPQNSGLPRYDQPRLNDMTRERVLAGYQIGFHAIGDAGVQMALDAFAQAEKAAHDAQVKGPTGTTEFRLRVEHAQVTTPAQIARFKELKVIASMQPCHLLTDMRWAQDRLGPKRAATSYAWLAFLNKGVTLAFGTDYPVEPVSPFRGLYAAVTRKSEDGKLEYFPDQRLTMDQAIAAYTTGSAFAEFEEKEKGKIAPGMLADFIELDRDITAVSAEKLLGTKVLRTVVGGKTVYQAK